MGKTKQLKEKKFDRNVEISAPILDPEIIKAIHTPPKGQRLNIKHGGFKALLSDLNSQDSTDELMPLNDDHVPSYIGISCAVSGYSNYSSYSKRPASGSQQVTSKTSDNIATTPTTNRSRATSPVLRKTEPQVSHITIDKNNIHSIDDERKELTEKLTASAVERNRQSPVPNPIPPTEDDRHHGAYVGARYCPLPTLSKVVNKHIPLLGIDDELDEEKALEEEQKENKVEHRIASLYGDKIVEDWRESMTHKAKKEQNSSDQHTADQQQPVKNPKDLVTLRPTLVITKQDEKASLTPETQQDLVDIPKAKVLANVEKQFLNKLLTDENPPVPIQSALKSAETTTTNVDVATRLASPAATSPSNSEQTTKKVNDIKSDVDKTNKQEENDSLVQSPTQSAPTPTPTPVSPSRSPAPMSPDSGKNHSVADDDLLIPSSQVGEEHIEYEIRAQSPVDNESSPVRFAKQEDDELLVKGKSAIDTDNVYREENFVKEKLVNPTMPVEPYSLVTNPEMNISSTNNDEDKKREKNLDDDDDDDDDEQPVVVQPITSSESVSTAVSYDGSDSSKDGRYYLTLLETEKSFILKEIKCAEAQLESEEADLDDDTKGKLRSAIGKANLLINKKFNQFRELCDANINKDSKEQFATLNDDLAGFWDMLSIQVSDVRKSFETLWQTKKHEEESGKKEEQQDLDNKEDSNSPTSNNSSNNNNNKNIKANFKPKLCAQKDQERRERLQEHILQMKQQNQAAKLSAETSLDESATFTTPSTTTTTKTASNDKNVSHESAFNEEESSLPQTTINLMDSSTEQQQSIVVSTIAETDKIAAPTQDKEREQQQQQQDLVDLSED